MAGWKVKYLSCAQGFAQAERSMGARGGGGSGSAAGSKASSDSRSGAGAG